MNLLLIFAGGGAGAVARYLMMTAVGRFIGTEFPWHTLSVNVLGAVFIGALTEFMALRVSAIEPMRFLLVTGFLGGFTTFSTFSLETAMMWEKGDYTQAALYAAASVIGTVIAVFGGTAAARLFL
ncbi:MAG: fluoride efflux transporter CrcB [Alphaproteobacteria bacterium]|nr:fluoride efflux transporter CrcB [Alphaproteobacteria bacterium]